jgi:hypothetical protein
VGLLGLKYVLPVKSTLEVVRWAAFLQNLSVTYCSVGPTRKSPDLPLPPPAPKEF